MICVIDNNNVIVNIVDAPCPMSDDERDYYPWNQLWGVYTDSEPFDYMKNRLNTALGAEFARRRDAVRFIDLPSGNRYGFDCAAEDITNFMAAFTPLLIAGNGETGYKVWTSETEKGLAMLSLADLQTVYTTVRESQLNAYVWLATAQEKLMAVMEADGKEFLQTVYNDCLAE